MRINEMQIARILNNNVVITCGDGQNETVVMGKGIGFQKKPGESINPDLIEKVFSLNTPYSEQFNSLLEQVPVNCIRAAEDIIELAKARLLTTLHASVLISLTDHLHYALQRFSEKIMVPNALLWEIRKFYPSEFAIGKEAVQIVFRYTGVLLPEDEAGYIALHLVNAQLKDNMQTTIKITRFIQDILSLVQYHFELEYNEDALNYQRFITHLKFFAQRIFDGKVVSSDDSPLPDLIKKNYITSHLCAEKISKYIELHYNYVLANDEIMFLTIHIEQLRK